jgi:hypothetical protein
MSIGKQIHAFLEVSETFLRQPAVAMMSDAGSPPSGARALHDDSVLRVGALLVQQETVNRQQG